MVFSRDSPGLNVESAALLCEAEPDERELEAPLGEGTCAWPGRRRASPWVAPKPADRTEGKSEYSRFHFKVSA